MTVLFMWFRLNEDVFGIGVSRFRLGVIYFFNYFRFPVISLVNISKNLSLF